MAESSWRAQARMAREARTVKVEKNGCDDVYEEEIGIVEGWIKESVGWTNVEV